MENTLKTHKHTEAKELTAHDILNILKQYKWSIIFITLIAAMLSYAYLYFKPSIYESYAIIKVKPHISNKSSDLIEDRTSTITSTDVAEEISLLKTFKINNNALNKIHFKVQYFTEEAYKQVEMYNTSPIKIQNIDILNKEIIGKKLTFIPKENGYSLHYTNSYKDKIENAIFKTKLFEFNNNTIFPYDKIISNKYFKLSIHKSAVVDKPIQFIINGNKREIFENIVKEQLEITQLEKDTSLIKISYKDTIPARAQLYVNALTKSFIQHSINSKNQQNNKTLDFIVKELNNIKQELKDSEQQLEKYQVAQSVIEPSVQASEYIRKLSDIEIQLSENHLKKKLILNLINFVQQNDNLDAIAPSLSKLDDQNTLRLITKLQDAQLLEEKLSIEYTDEYPKLQSVRKQINNIREKIAFNLKNLRTNIQYQNNNLIARKNTYENDLKKLPSQERQLVNIKRNYEVKSKMYEYLLKKKSENKIVQFSTFSDYQIIDHAYNSNLPIKEERSLIIFILSILFGFLFGSILALIRHYGNRKIQNKQDLTQLTSLPIYGSIPFYKQKPNQLEVHTQAKSPFTESFRTLRTNLQFMKQEDQATTILITSTIAGEGKTTTSANLATILEMAKYKTLVINLDLRKPTLHKFFSVNNNMGVSTYLNGNHNLEDIILTTEFANLDIITSGPIPLDPSELILSKRLPALLEKLKTMYDYIILDSAPIGIVTDTKTIMQYSDLNLILLREDYAKKDFISTLEQIIEKHQFKNIGLILNASKEEGGEYGYGYSYEYEH